MESLTSDITTLRDKLKSVKEQMEKTDEEFRHQMESFLNVCLKNNLQFILT